MSQQQYIEFNSQGFKVDTETFEVIALDSSYVFDEPMYITDIPSWDISDMYEVMPEHEKENFNQLLMRAVRSLPNAS